MSLAFWRYSGNVIIVSIVELCVDALKQKCFNVFNALKPENDSLGWTNHQFKAV